MEMLRDRIKGLERKIMEMIRYGQDNMSISDRLHRWTRAVMLTHDPARIAPVLLRDMQHQFMIPQAALRIWGVATEHAGLPCAADFITRQNNMPTDIAATFPFARAD